LLKARIGEISCPTRYFPEASSINLRRSIVYGLAVVKTSVQCWLAKHGWFRFPMFKLSKPELHRSETRVLLENRR
jgi:hypothetical protein